MFLIVAMKFLSRLRTSVNSPRIASQVIDCICRGDTPRSAAASRSAWWNIQYSPELPPPAMPALPKLNPTKYPLLPIG